MAEKIGMDNKLRPVPPYSTIYRSPLEVVLGGERLLLFSEKEGDGGLYAGR